MRLILKIREFLGRGRKPHATPSSNHHHELHDCDSNPGQAYEGLGGVLPVPLLSWALHGRLRAYSATFFWRNLFSSFSSLPCCGWDK